MIEVIGVIGNSHGRMDATGRYYQPWQPFQSMPYFLVAGEEVSTQPPLEEREEFHAKGFA